MDPIHLEIFLDDKTRAGVQTAQGNIDLFESTTKQVIKALETELAALQKKMTDVRSQGLSGEKEQADVQAMRGAIAQLKTELELLKKVKMEVSETPMNPNTAPMENATKRTNQLAFSMQQVARELPSLAMGPQMFFLAISNNIPILTDSITKAKQANDELAASGQKGIPIWKQLLSSIMSWQTVMVVGLTLLVVFGKEISNWVKNIGAGAEALDDITIKQQVFDEVNKKHTEAVKSANAEYGKQMTTLTSLKSQWDKLGNSLDEKKKFINDNKSAFNDLGLKIGSVKDAENLLVDNTESFVQAMKVRAQAIASQSTLEDLYAKKNEADNNADFKRRQAAIRRENPRKADQEEASRKMYVPSIGGSNTGAVNVGASTKTWTPEEVAAEVAKGYEVQATNFETRSKYLQASIDRITKSMISNMQNYKKVLSDANMTEGSNDAGGKSSSSKTNYGDLLEKARIDSAAKVEAMKISIMQDGIDKRKALLKQEYDNNITAIDQNEKKQQEQLSKGIKNGTVKDPDQAKKSIASDAAAQRVVVLDKYNHDSNELDKKYQKENIESWIKYAKEYGTAQEKKLALTTEYAMKIKEANTTEDDKKFLSKKLEDDLQAVDFENLKKSINWESVFGNLDKVSTSTLDNLKKKLKDYISQTKDLKPESLKAVADALDDIDKKKSERSPFKVLKESFDDLGKATDKETAAQKAYNKALKEGTAEEIKNAKETLNNAKDAKQKSLSTATQALHDGVSKARDYVEAGNQVLGIMETVGIKTPEWMTGYMNGVGEMLDGLESIDLTKPMSIVAGSLQTIKGALMSVISLGGLIPGFGTADYSSYNKMVEEYNGLSKIWDELIDKKQKYIGISYGEEAAKVGAEAVALQKKVIQSFYTLGIEKLNAGASAGSHSIGVRQRKGMSSAGWAELDAWQKANGTRYDFGGRMETLFKLTGDQLASLKSEAPTFWAKLDEDVRNYLDNIIEGSEKLEEIQSQIKESLTQVSFDSVYESFSDMLLDMDSDSKDTAEKVAEYFQRAIISTKLSNKYKEQLQSWYDSFADANADSNITPEEQAKLKSQYDSIVNSALAERNALMKTMGWTSTEAASSQSGRSGDVTTITEQTAGKLEGLGNAAVDKLTTIEDLIKDLKKSNEDENKLLSDIAKNTAYCKELQPIKEAIIRIEQNGIKTL